MQSTGTLYIQAAIQVSATYGKLVTLERIRDVSADEAASVIEEWKRNNPSITIVGKWEQRTVKFF